MPEAQVSRAELDLVKKALFIKLAITMLANPSFFDCSSTCIWIFALSFVPSMLWLVLFWLQDKHPEPKRLVFHTFFWGMLVAVPVIVLEGVAYVFALPLLKTLGIAWVYGFVGVAFVEEAAKYVVLRIKALPMREFNEPQDAVLYMVAAALGFAAVENALFILPLLWHNQALMGLEVITNRFVGANLLHALSSGIVGFFLARAWFSPYRHHFLALGIILAAILHTGFNYLILIRETFSQATFYIILLLITMAVMVFIDF